MGLFGCPRLYCMALTSLRMAGLAKDIVSVVSKEVAVFLDPFQRYVTELLDHPDAFWLSLSCKGLSHSDGLALDFPQFSTGF